MNERVLCYTSGTSSQGKRGLTSCVVEAETAPWGWGLHVSAATQMDSALGVCAVLSGSVHEVLLPCVCVKLSKRGPQRSGKAAKVFLIGAGRGGREWSGREPSMRAAPWISSCSN